MRTERTREIERAYYLRNRRSVLARKSAWKKANPEYNKRRNEARKAARLAIAKPFKPKPILTEKQAHERRLHLARCRRHYEKIRVLPAFRIKNCVRAAIRRLIEGGAQKVGRSLKYLGCSLDQARSHIESQFKPGMSWENHGDWHIDHIKPISAFDLNNPSEAEAATRWDNLQPLWAKENLAKGAQWAA